MQCAYQDLLTKAPQLQLCVDSRDVQPGALFFAVPGTNEDGLKYVADAVARGAAYVVCQDDNTVEIATTYPQVSVCGVAQVRRAVWQLAKAHYHTDVTPLQILGITGTNGKTTCTYLLESLLQTLGHKVGVIGTVNYRYPGVNKPAPLTTPDALTLHKWLAEMENVGCDFAILEVSSHALEQERVYGLPFAGCAFTNLTQDHLDFHETMANYFAVKQRLFTEVGRLDKQCVINVDDPYGVKLADLCPQALTFSLQQHLPEQQAKLTAELLRADTQGCHLRMHYQGDTWELQSPLIGAFNAANLLTVQALAISLGCSIPKLQALANFTGVKGRLERVKAQGKHVFVDYAHTPDALENVLLALRNAGFKHIITVFGCGGNRDRGKRPKMGRVVAKLADVAVLTSDNPRFEEPLAIIEDVKPGLQGAKQVVINPDRRAATIAALDMLRNSQDADAACVLIAGKGHEDYQIIQGKRHHYSDQEVVEEYFKCN